VPNGGVAIGFSFTKVQKGFLIGISQDSDETHVENAIQPSLDNPLLPCRYTDKNGQLDVGPIVAEHFFKENLWAAMFARHPEHWSFAATLSVAIYRIVCSIKHGAYATEREWRCVNFCPDPNRYPVRLSETNRFFIELAFDPKEFVKEVWISPHGDVGGFERALNYTKQENDLDFTIEKSKIPFRA
jgi:hypothetical protein